MQSASNRDPRRNDRSARRLLIHPRFQIPLIATNLAVILVFFAVAWVGTQNAILDLKPAAGLSSMEADFFRKYVEYQAWSLQRSLFLALGAGILTAGTLTLVISHRLAGPIIRLRIFFQSIIDGKSKNPRITFRDGDYLRELEPLINTAMDRIQRTDQSGEQALKKSA